MRRLKKRGFYRKCRENTTSDPSAEKID